MTKDPSKIHSEILEVGADQALEWLEENRTNRPLRYRLVSTYARDMVAGAWQETGEAIKFDRDGNLLDGQHRLNAVLAADDQKHGVTVKMMVVWGLDPDAQRVMDSGARRTAGDSLALDGVPNAHLTASVARLAIQYETDDLFGSKRQLTTPQIREWVDANPGVEPFISKYQHDARDIPAPGASAVLAAAWIFTKIDADKAAEFMHGLASQEAMVKGDPRQVLYQRFVSIQVSREKVRQADVMGYMILAWNAFRKGKKLAHLRRNAQSWNQETFPKPI